MELLSGFGDDGHYGAAIGGSSEEVEEYLLHEMSSTAHGDLRLSNGDLKPSIIEEEGEKEKGDREKDVKKCNLWMNQCKKNWKKILVLTFLWIAYFLCRAANSTIAPFFPVIVSVYVWYCCQYSSKWGVRVYMCPDCYTSNGEEHKKILS